MLVVCFTVSCASKYCPPYKVTGVYKLSNSCMLYLRDADNRDFETYYHAEYCNYKIGDELK